jgi:hypothetical protein
MPTSTQVTAAPATPANADQSLPDASGFARVTLFVLLLLAVALAMAWNKWWATGAPFDPPKGDFNFSLFAAFYAAAQIIERVMELAVPLLPIPAIGTDHSVRTAHLKADRAKIALGLAALAGVAASCAFGLFFLQTIGISSPSNTVDALCTGVLIAAGTKPLHDFISLLQNQNNPTTGSTVA